MTIAFADRLCALRRARGLSQEELAAQLGVSRQAVSKWERAEASPDTDNLIALAQLYGVSLDALVGHMPSASKEEENAAVSVETAITGVPDENVAVPASQNTAPSAAQSEPATPARTSRWLAFPYPVLCTLVFLILGFAGGWWHPGWLVFLTIPFYYCLVDILVHHRSAKHFPYPVLCAVVYLVLGFLCDWWHPGWLLFLTIPLYYCIVE